MIWDSTIWKTELIKELSNFKKYLKQIKSDKYSTEHFVLGLEKFHFVSCFIIRKLIENQKISNELMQKEYSIGKYERINTDNRIDILNNIRFEDFYDLDNCVMSTITIKQTCNKFVHSFIFSPTFDEDRKMSFLGVFVNSDFDKDKFVYHLDYEVFVEMINDVISDDVLHFEIIR